MTELLKIVGEEIDCPYRPLGEMVLLAAAEPTKRPGKLHLPDSAVAATQAKCWRVLAKGPGRTNPDTGELIDTMRAVAVGDIVLIYPGTVYAQPFRENGKEYALVPIIGIQAVRQG